MIYPAPSYLTGLVTEVDKSILSIIQEEYGDSTTAFKFNNRFTGLVLTWLQEYDQYGGTIWGIDDANISTTLFNQSTHGYNGVMGLNEEEDLNSTKNIDLENNTDVIIAFQYSGDEADYAEDGNSKFEQDYFGWVSIYQYTNGQLQEIRNYECA